MRQSDRIALQKMIAYCDDVADLRAQFGDSFECFTGNKAYQYAAGMCIVQIGELVSRLSDEAKAEAPDIPWRLIRGMRNVYAHDYDQTKPATIWQTLTEDIPRLKAQLERLVAHSTYVNDTDEEAIP